MSRTRVLRGHLLHTVTFLVLITKQNKTGSKMDNCYSVDHNAEDYLHTDITCNIEELQQKYRLGMVCHRFLEGGA